MSQTKQTRRGKAWDAQKKNDEQDLVLANHESRITAAEVTLVNHEQRITAAEATLVNHETRITAAEAKLVEHETRITANESELANHETRITQNTTDIAGLTVRMVTAESNITSLQTNVASLTTRVTTAEGNITTLQERFQQSKPTMYPRQSQRANQYKLQAVRSWLATWSHQPLTSFRSVVVLMLLRTRWQEFRLSAHSEQVGLQQPALHIAGHSMLTRHGRSAS